MPSCVVRSCGNKNAGHRFPRDPVLRYKWFQALSFDANYQPTEFSRVCKFHFLQSDYKKGSSRKTPFAKLKKNAIPSVFKEFGRFAKRSTLGYWNPQNKMFDENNLAVTQEQNAVEVPVNSAGICQNTGTECKVECRVCLKIVDVSVGLYELFQPWCLTWHGMESTIAADLSKIAKIQISQTDVHSKLICYNCCVKLRDACEFIASVRRSDQILRLRCMETGGSPVDSWPKPIKLDMGINTTVMEVDIKQEIVSEPECDNESVGSNNDASLANHGIGLAEIKVEPEEIVDQKPSDNNINGIRSGDFDPQYSESNNNDQCIRENLLDMVKEEPPSEGENEEMEITPDLPLECMLCTKVFHRVTGLKAHVIAQHSYKTVRRKSDSNSPVADQRNERYVCEICKRVFHTPTDLMVHVTCHNKHTCFECNEKFDTFVDLTNHRNLCKVIQSKGLQKLKTLDDVRRPQIDSSSSSVETSGPAYPMLRVKSSEELGAMSLHFQIHSVRSVTDQDMTVEALDSNFSEDDSSFNNCYT